MPLNSSVIMVFAMNTCGMALLIVAIMSAPMTTPLILP